jgi:hypothetical protein
MIPIAITGMTPASRQAAAAARNGRGSSDTGLDREAVQGDVICLRLFSA